VTGPPQTDAHAALGAILTGTEAKQLAERLAAGDTVTRALTVIGAGRRTIVSALLAEIGTVAGLSAVARWTTVAVLRGIAGAHSHPSRISAVWTAPDNLAQHGRLTATMEHFVRAARESVVCSTFNFQRTSALWVLLREVAARPHVTVRVYLDGAAASSGGATPTTADVAAELVGATVLASRNLARNHAKFIAVDHQYLLVTSANFSYSAELGNVELGLLVENPLLTQAVERQMLELEPRLYRRVAPAADR
jgi:hypothetical protein